MTNVQKSGGFLIAGLLMLLGVVGGVEASPDLISYDGVYLAVFTLVGMAFMAIGAAYANEASEEFKDNPTLR